MPVQAILAKIARQKCVLLLGPDLHPVGGRSLTQHLRREVHAQFKDSFEYHHDREGFFLFKPGEKDEAEIDIRSAMERLCEQVRPDEEALKKIARLPFHLVVSASPDLFLSETCCKHRVPHRFGWYKSRGGSPTDAVAEPTPAEPLLYNLCGSVRHGALLLDYEDLFLFIQSLLGVPGLPKHLKDALDDAETFLFLGFSFERWYTQLLLRLLCGSKRLKKYAGKHPGVKPDTKDFLFHQFKIQFLDGEPDTGADAAEPRKDFLTRLYEAAENYQDDALDGKPFLRTLLDPASPAEVKVIRWVQEGKIGKALDELQRAARGSRHAGDVVALQARWSNHEAKKFKLDSRDIVVEFNQITDAVLETARDIFKQP